MMLKNAVVVAVALHSFSSALAFDATPKPTAADYPNVPPAATLIVDYNAPKPTPMPQAPNSLRPWPKTQIRLQIQEGLWKIVRIPFFLLKDGVELFKKGYHGYTKDFFEKYDLKLSYENQNGKKVSQADGTFQIFAYNRNFETKADIFDFKTLLKDMNAYEKKSCDEVCPKGLELLSINRDQLLPTGENFLGFRNKADDFTHSIANQSGYCWGHSSVMDDFHYLGFFDKDNLMNQDVPSIGSTKSGGADKTEWREFYKDLIDDMIIHGRPTVIPGFENVRSLVDSDDELKEYVKERVAYKWAKNAVKLRSIGNMFFDGKPMKKERVQKLVQEIEKRLLSNQTPRVIFAAEGDSTYSHVLNVYGLEKNKEGYRIYLFETNYYTELYPSQSHFLEVSNDWKVTYAPLEHSRIGHNRIGKVKFSFEEEDAEIAYVRSLHRFCTMMTRCQK